MPTTWSFVDATAAEREAFASLDAALAKRRTLAAPENTFRVVWRIEAEGRTYYLKEFRHTQLKNRIRNSTTPPRCDLDAEREAAVAAALVERGFTVARRVAVGARDGASYYLCAELPGRTVRELREAGAWSEELDGTLADFCGSIAAHGVVLTDLSADHVFVADGEFALIDLHNGRLRRRPRLREAVRMLRRFAKSVRGLGISRRRALRFAVRLLRAAKLGPVTRTVVSRLPPYDTHGRYDAGDRAARYRVRNPKRTAREIALLARVWPGSADETVLDSPSGAGRLGQFVRSRNAVWIPSDRSAAMLRELRDAHPGTTAVQADAATLPFADDSVDGVVVFRFLHHVDGDAARRVVEEAARVARRWVAITFFHPVSAHNAQRGLRAWLGGTPRTRFTRTPREMRSWLESAGFRGVEFAAEARYRRDLWIVRATR